MLFTLRLRKPFGVTTTLIEATSLEKAILVGQAYCAKSPNYRYISVEPAISADETILKGTGEQDVATPARQTRVGA